MSGMTERELVSTALAGKPSKGWQRANCPLCAELDAMPDHKQSLGVNTDTGGYVCHRCQRTGKLDGYEVDLNLMLEQELSAARAAAADPGPTAGPPPYEPNPDKPVEPCQGFIPLWGDGATASSTEQARVYLEGRNIPAGTWSEAGIGCTLGGFHGGRVVVPHLLPGGPQRNPWCGWFGRDYTGFQRDTAHRYSKGLARDRLWNEQALYADTDQPLALVEGCLDALPLWPDAAAFLGKPTDIVVEMLARHRGRPLVIALDGDAWEEGWALAVRLKFQGVPATAVRLPGGTDPGTHPALVAAALGKSWPARPSRDA